MDIVYHHLDTLHPTTGHHGCTVVMMMMMIMNLCFSDDQSFIIVCSQCTLNKGHLLRFGDVWPTNEISCDVLFLSQYI